MGCGNKPPPPPPPSPSAQPEAPPPPKCEDLKEKCSAKGDTKAKIASTSLVFVPTSGWTYAQLSIATIAQTSEDGACFAIMGYDGDAKDAKKDAAARDAALAELAKQLNLGQIKKKPLVNWKKADDNKTTAGDVKVGLWQVEGGTRGAKKGPLLIAAGPIEGGKGVIGLGFVPSDDSSGADQAILKSIESIGKDK